MPGLRTDTSRGDHGRGSALIAPELLVEIEADAYLES